MQFRASLPRDHEFLLPPRVDEWVPAGHMARIINEAVDLMELSDVEATFHATGAGAPAYHPKALLKVLTYGYMTQRFSSRRMSTACREDLAMMWLAQLEQPQHSTIADFRKRHVDDIPGWMAQIVVLCADLGMVGFRLGAIDGSKLQADASKHKALSYQRMQEVLPALEAEIATLVEAHAVADQQETAPPAVPADRLARLRERLDRIQQAKADLEARWASEHPDAPTPPGKEQWNFTDPDSHIMVTKTRGVQQAYNAQHIDAYIAAGSDQWRQISGQTLFGKGQFTYDAARNRYRCPAEQILPWRRTRTERIGGGASRTVDVYQADRATCGVCPLKGQCLTAKQTVKVITRGPDDDLRDAMKAKVRSEAGAVIYRTRKGQVEPAFGIIKETLGFRQFSLRGLRKVAGEWALVCMTYNLRKIGQKIQRIAYDTGEIGTIVGLRAAYAAP